MRFLDLSYGSGVSFRKFAWAAAVLSALVPVSAASRHLARDAYDQHCVGCHGSDGAGRAGAERPVVPDFRDCNTASRATDSELVAEVRYGGAHGVSRSGQGGRGARLDEATIEALVALVRTFCAEPGWPPGELNPAAPLFTVNGYPEDELALGFRGNPDDDRAGGVEWLYSKRVGRLAAFELSLPMGAVETESGGHWNGGVGDLTLAGKVVVYQSLRRGLIAALGHELVLPTGDEDRGLGSGTVVFAPFAAITQLLPANAAFHAQLIGEIPTDRDRSEPRIELRTAFSRTFSKVLGEREWSPMFEVLARRVFDKGGRDIQVDLVPQFEVSLSRTKHVTLAVGVVVPMTDSSERATQLAIDLKWDWFAKKFFEGW